MSTVPSVRPTASESVEGDHANEAGTEEPVPSLSWTVTRRHGRFSFGVVGGNAAQAAASHILVGSDVQSPAGGN